MSLIDMMNSMQNQRLLDNGEYMVIHVDMMTYSQREAQKYLWSKYILYTSYIYILLISPDCACLRNFIFLRSYLKKWNRRIDLFLSAKYYNE